MRRFPEQILLKFHDPYYFKTVRKNTEMIAAGMGFSENKIFELSMAVDEAYTNAIEHSFCKSGQDIEVKFLVFEDRLEISIADSGCGFDSSCLEIPETLKHLNTVRGRGLSLIKKLSDKFEVDSSPGNGTRVRILKFVRRTNKRQRDLPFSV